jgi:hypoxanthine phosphoribosyltransferase
MLECIKKPLRKHRFYQALRFLCGKKPERIVFSYSDAYLMVDDWLHYLPEDYDCIIGIPRGGLIIADYIALHLGVPLSTPFNFVRGCVWQSHLLEVPAEFRKVLLVEDGIGEGAEMYKALTVLKTFFPKVVFETAALVISSKPEWLDYFYCFNGNIAWTGDKPKLRKKGLFVGDRFFEYTDLIV